MPLTMEPRPSLEHYGSILRMHRRQRAPPGVTPNYVNPETTSDQVTITGLTLIILSALFVVARLGVKLRVVKKRSWDDYWITFAWLLALARVIITTINAERLHLGYHTWDIPPSVPYTRGELQKNLLFIGDMLYLISIMSTKIAILLLYKALFGVKRSFRYLCYGMMAIVTSYCVIFFFIFAFHCNPVQKAWQIITFRGPSTCFGLGTIQIVVGGFNIATDFIILIMPMPIILGLNMDWKRKIGLLVIFGTGIVVLASSIVRQVIVVQHLHEIVGGPNTRNLDASWVTAQETLWLTVENDIGIICACLPSLAPLRTTRFFSKTLPEYVSYLRTKSSHHSAKDGSSGHAPTKGSFKGVLGYHASAESGVELVNNAPKNGEYVSANHGEGGLTHENGTIKRETDMQVTYSSRPYALA